MTNQYNDYDDDDDYGTEDSGPANLRKALKKAEKEAKAMRDELDSLRAQSRQRNVKDVLETKGVNPKIAAFIPADVDAPEKIAAWLDEYADVFGFQAPAQSDQQELSEGAVTQRRMDESTQSASTPGREEDMISRLTSVNSKEELDQLIFGTSIGRNF